MSRAIDCQTGKCGLDPESRDERRAFHKIPITITLSRLLLLSTDSVTGMNVHSSLGIAAAVGGGLFLAYCVYFDHKRRSDPLFKQKLKARRAQAKKDAESSRSVRGLPDMTDLEAVQKFFVQELQFGEELLAMGEIESGVEHLSNAIAVCGQPQQLLQILQQTLPAPVFQLILARLPVISQQLNEREPRIRAASQELVDDDVE